MCETSLSWVPRPVQREPVWLPAPLPIPPLSTLKVQMQSWPRRALMSVTRWWWSQSKRNASRCLQVHTSPMAAPWTPITTSPPSAPASPCLRCSLAAAVASFTSLWRCSGSSSTWLAASAPHRNLTEVETGWNRCWTAAACFCPQVEQFVSEPFLKSLDDCLAEALEVRLQMLLCCFSTSFVLWEI